MTTDDSTYTFGDNDRARDRLRALAELYEPETRDLICRRTVLTPLLAADLGCGPGHSTRLLHSLTGARATVGLEASARYVREAARRTAPGLSYHRHDVTRTPFPVAGPDLLLCRFLLTHLAQPDRVLEAWAHAARPGACLLIHETERLDSGHPALARYYALVGELQAHYGQSLTVGAGLEGLVLRSRWTLHDSRAVVRRKPAAAMAGLHLANLRTWKHDPFARVALRRRELARLERALERIASGRESVPPVRNVARQIVAVRR